MEANTETKTPRYIEVYAEHVVHLINLIGPDAAGAIIEALQSTTPDDYDDEENIRETTRRISNIVSELKN